MSIVILVGGHSSEGNYEHRYVVQQFLQRFPDQIQRIVTTDPVNRSIPLRIKRTLKRGQYLERLRRLNYNKQHPQDPSRLGKLLFPDGAPEKMPGGPLVQKVPGHNHPECEKLLTELAPDVIVVYGTMLIHEHISTIAKKYTLNMHTGLSPWYRGDSTLFWPVYFDDKEKLGVTVHQLVPEVDGGDIVHTRTISYTPGDDEQGLFAKGVKAGADIYLQAVEEALEDRIEFQQQELSLGREFRWIHRTVAAEHKVKQVLAQWESAAGTSSSDTQARKQGA